MSNHMRLVLLVHFGHRLIVNDTVCSCNGSLQMVRHALRRRFSCCMCVLAVIQSLYQVHASKPLLGYHSPHDISNTHFNSYKPAMVIHNT